MEPTQYDLAVARVLRRKRLVAGLTQKNAGAAVGITLQQLQKYEKAANRVSFSRFMELAAAYDTTPEQILTEVRAELDTDA